MTVLLILGVLAALGAVLTLAMTIHNLRGYIAPAITPSDELVSVCIPARNEQNNIEDCVRSVLGSEHANVEVLVYDDDSSDRTLEILDRLEREDPRVRRVPTAPLPEGWSGKQHACDRMGRAARGGWILFTDADVRFGPGAVGAAMSFAERSGADLVSTFPRQIVGTLGELLLTPTMFFVLMSFLPMGRMRRTPDPSASAGCGQFLLARREAYIESGGHAAFRASMHDGVKMPRAFRRRGFRTDLFDGTDHVRVRMYTGLIDAWKGFAKNAFEGLGSVGLLVFISVFHAVAHIGPWILAPVAFATGSTLAGVLFTSAVVMNAGQRLVLSARFRHTRWLALLHPITIAMMTAVQWHSLLLHRRRARSWRGRTLAGDGRERVVLVDELDREIGTEEKQRAHLDGGRLHRAFSVLLFDPEGRVLLQKRAASKYHFGGLWSNTCCGHPRPGEEAMDGARRRLAEELGIHTALEPAGMFTYSATHDGTGLTEREIDRVFVGRYEGGLRPDPSEVEGSRWIDPADLEREMRDVPERFTPWFRHVWEHALRSGSVGLVATV